VKNPPLFPTPYPDELFYSILCRYRLRIGNSKVRTISQELYGSRKNSNVLFPRFIDRIVSLLPSNVGFSTESFIQNTTLFPYYTPYISAERSKTFRAYMQSSEGKVEFFALGFGKQRHPQNERFRFCKSCWDNDIATYGEPYWHRLHQLPGVMVCHLHSESLYEVPLTFLSGATNFYAASTDIINYAVPCGGFSDSVFEKLIALSENASWILQNGSNLGSYEKTLNKYDSWFCQGGFRTFQGKTRNQELHSAVIEYFGADFLRLLNAYDNNHNGSWSSRIAQYHNSPTHPLYHMLLAEFLAGSVKLFFELDCETPLNKRQK
jgi:hypothetical protein